MLTETMLSDTLAGMLSEQALCQEHAQYVCNNSCKHGASAKHAICVISAAHAHSALATTSAHVFVSCAQLQADPVQGLSPAQLRLLPNMLMPRLAMPEAAVDTFVSMMVLPGLQPQELQQQALSLEQLQLALRSCRDAVKQATAMQR